MTGGNRNSVSAINSVVFTCRVSLVAKPAVWNSAPEAEEERDVCIKRLACDASVVGFVAASSSRSRSAWISW